MVGRGSYAHEKGIIDFLTELRDTGWKTINLKGLSPDGITVKNNKVIAIEILTTNKNININDDYHCIQKRDQYSMFDDVYIRMIPKDRYNESRAEDKVYTKARKERDEEKIDEFWSKFENKKKESDIDGF